MGTRARVRNALIALAVLLVLFVLFGYLIAPGMIQRAAEDKLSLALGRKTTLSSVAVHPLTLGVTLKDLRIARADGSAALLEVGRIEAGVSLRSLVRLAPVVDHLRITAPHIAIVRLASGRFDFSDILDRLAAQPRSTSKAEFSINNIEITEGLVTFDDRVTGSVHRLEDITLDLPFISNIRHDVELFVEPAFSGRIDGTVLTLKGKSKPFQDSLETSVDVHLAGLDLPDYVGFSPVALVPKLASGVLSTDLSIGFSREADGIPRVKLSGHAAVDRLRLLKPDGAPAVSAQRIGVDLASLDLLSGAIDLNALEIDGLRVSATRTPEGTIDLATLIGTAAGPEDRTAPATGQASVGGTAAADPSRVAAPPGVRPAAPANQASGPAFAIRAFRLTDGELHFEDHSSPTPFVAELHDIQVKLANLSSQPGAGATFEMGLATAPHETIALTGQTSLAAKTLTLHYSVSDLHLAPFGALLRGLTAARLYDGALDSAGDLDVQWGYLEPVVKISHVNATLKHVGVGAARGHVPILSADSISIENASIDLSGRSTHIDTLNLAGPAARVIRAADGTVDLVALIGGSTKPEGAETTGAAPQTGASTPAPARPPARAASAPGASRDGPAPYELSIAAVNLTDGKVGLQDGSVSPAGSLQLDKITLALHDVRLNPGARIPFQCTARANQKGAIEIKGELVPLPFAVSATLAARGVPLAPLQGYAGRRLNVTLANADVSVRGTLKLVTAPKTDLRFGGTVEVADLAALDKVTSADFVRWKSLVVPDIDAHIQGPADPITIALGDVVLSDFYSRLIVYPDGRLNLQNLVTPEGSSAPQSVTTTGASGAPPEPAAPPPALADPSLPAKPSATATEDPSSASGPAALVRIASVRLADGSINFTDNFVKPNYTTSITALNGSVARFASDSAAPAAVTLKGSIEGNGDLSVTGMINPLTKPLYLDIAANATNIELTRLTPYALKYAGYGIEKGKLSMNVTYHIEDNQLKAQNKLFLDQLTFGDHVDSPTATKLPVLLAVRLLKDSNGQINIDLPISGALSDPQFSIGGVLVRVIVNVLEKALLSPFQLLGALGAGGNAELGYIEFEPGRSALSAPAREKIATLARILAERPALRLDITGRAETAADAEPARSERLAAAVRQRKFQALVDQGQKLNEEDVVVDAAEYPRYLEEVYREATFAKPTNALGFTKHLEPAEMERLLLQNMAMSDSDLLALGDARANVVRDALEATGKIDRSRLFIVASTLMTEPPKDKGRPTRVDFTLR